MGRLKGKYIAQVIINVDMEYTETDLPIAKVKERFARMMTPMVQEALQKGCGRDASVEVHQRKADIYEVTE